MNCAGVDEEGLRNIESKGEHVGEVGRNCRPLQS